MIRPSECYAENGTRFRSPPSQFPDRLDAIQQPAAVRYAQTWLTVYLHFVTGTRQTALPLVHGLFAFGRTTCTNSTKVVLVKRPRRLLWQLSGRDLKIQRNRACPNFTLSPMNSPRQRVCARRTTPPCMPSQCA